jgi:hypothetical protein
MTNFNSDANTINNAMKTLMYYTNSNRDGNALKSFTDACFGGACEKAINELWNAMTGNQGSYGCNILDQLYDGDITHQSAYFQGWRD